MPKRSSLDDIVQVILARNEGYELEDALALAGVSASKYFANLSRNLGLDLVSSAAKSNQAVIRDILNDEERTISLFDAPRKMISDQYQAIMEAALIGSKKIFFHGLFFHTAPSLNGVTNNRKVLHLNNMAKATYVAFSHYDPNVSDSNRTVAIDALKAMDGDGMYFCQKIRLSGVFSASGDSYLEIFRLFDRERSSVLNQPRLFDLSVPVHMHEWDFPGNVTSGYWLEPSNLEPATYHVLGEVDPVFREGSVDEIRAKMKTVSYDYLIANGLARAVATAIEHKKPALKLILGAYDAERQRVQNVPSLFSE